MSEEFSETQDMNKNGIIDDDELTSEQIVIKNSYNISMRDINSIFLLTYLFTIVLLAAKFAFWYFFRILVEVNVEALAICLNLFIVLVSTAEGIRSIVKTGTGEISSPVPAYKLRYLFGFLIAFVCVTIFAIGLEFLTKFCAKSGEIIPEYSMNSFLDGVVANVISYLVARYGNKLFENVDLTCIKLFKK